MAVEELVALVGTGNWGSLESEWLRALGNSPRPDRELAGYASVLEEVTRRDQAQKAADLAWAALESLAAQLETRSLARVGGQFLVAVGNHGELRKYVADLYRKGYPDTHGLERLIDIAGLVEGRPVRRAVRTLEVCLTVSPGDYLIARHDDGAARVEAIDALDWSFTIDLIREQSELGAVALADEYAPAASDDYRVMRHFAREALLRRTQEDPLWLVLQVCTQCGGAIDSELLQRQLVPSVLTAGQWSKWFTAARNELRKSRHFLLEGRSPYTIRYVEAPSSSEEDLLNACRAARGAAERLEIMENYIKEARRNGAAVSQESLVQCATAVSAEVAQSPGDTPTVRLCRLLIAARAGMLAGDNRDYLKLVELVRGGIDLGSVAALLEDEDQLRLLCDCVAEALPDQARELLSVVLPQLPAGICDHVATRLVEAGMGCDGFAPIVQHIFSNSMDYLDALLWLWEGPRKEADIHNVPLITLLTRILATMEQARRTDSLPKARLLKMRSRTRSALSAKRYARFIECLGQIGPDMARVLRTQLRRAEYLGRSIHEDMLALLRERFPDMDTRPKVPLWQRENVVYSTADGLRRRQAEQDELVNVKMRENARAIGEAAAHGDLSENSEYKFALEERDLLRSRLAQMNAELSQAQVLDAAEVPTDRVGIGTRIGVRRLDDGTEAALTFLGPWDTDSDHNVFNYKAPAGQQLMEKTIGDVVELKLGSLDGRYEIISLSNALTH